jgi:hypothetical protein
MTKNHRITCEFPTSMKKKSPEKYIASMPWRSDLTKKKRKKKKKRRRSKLFIA